MGLVTPPRVQMQGDATSAMPTRIVKERQRSRCALGGVTLRASGIYGRMAASQLLRDVASIASSSLLALTRNSHLPDPPHFYHGLLEAGDGGGVGSASSFRVLPVPAAIQVLPSIYRTYR